MKKNGKFSIFWIVIIGLTILSQVSFNAWIVIIIIIICLAAYILIETHQKKKADDQLKTSLIDIEKEFRYNILEKFNTRYQTEDERLKHSIDIINLINRKKNINLSLDDAKFILDQNRKECNMDIIEKNMLRLKDKSLKNVAKMLLKINNVTFIDKTTNTEINSVPNMKLQYKDIYIKTIIEGFKQFLSRHELKCDFDKLERYLNDEITSDEASKFNKKLSRNADKKITVKDIANLNGFEFEKLLGKIYKNAWYKVRVTKKSWDQWADLIIEKDWISTAIQAKRYTGSVGNSAIQAIVAAMKFYDCDKAMVITTANFTKSAIELAQRNWVELVEEKWLNNLLDSVL